MQMTILFLGMAILMASAYGDVRMRRIPNVLTYSLAALGALQLILMGDLNVAFWTIASGVAVLVVGFLLFWGGLFGGGEAKLLTGAVLLIGSRDLLGFLLLVIFCGAIAMLALMIEYDFGRWLQRVMRPASARLVNDAAGATAAPTVPYGIAIAIGAVMILSFRTLSLR